MSENCFYFLLLKCNFFQKKKRTNTDIHKFLTTNAKCNNKDFSVQFENCVSLFACQSLFMDFIVIPNNSHFIQTRLLKDDM